MSQNPSAARFPTTQWSRVLRAGDASDREGRDALEQLCRDYWYPLYAFARRRGLDREEAGDLVQGFLADLLERGDLTKADPSRGRFRSFLRTACSHFLSHAREHDRALKRGGGRAPVSIDLRDAEGRYIERTSARSDGRTSLRAALGDGPAWTRLGPPGIGGARQWQIALLVRLRPLLEGDKLVESYKEIAETLEISEGAVKVAAHRFRGRYRQILREEVARTVADPGEVDAELADLLKALA